MTKEEFEAIQKAHTKLELKILRLEAKQRKLLEPLINQCVECQTSFGAFFSGTVVSCWDGRYVRIRPSNDSRSYSYRPQALRYIEKEGQDESDGTGHDTEES